MFRITSITAAAVLLISLFTVGCGGNSHLPPENTVTGTIVMGGKPLEKGTIYFESPEDIATGTAASGEITDGKFEVPVTTGKKTVRIVSMVDDGPPDETGLVPQKNLVPPKYNDSSTLTFEVKPGENTHDFTLTP